MIHLNKTLVLILAGGVGSRLNILVHSRAKPAVPFGGLYRIIDFSLSNATNSGLSQIGVLTQYKPLSLMNHLGTGHAWDLAGRTRGVKILPPRTGSKDSDWYKGTADAIRRNIDFIKSHPSKEVLLLSGDHIYQMDFDHMLKEHRAKNADITIGMMVVEGEQIKQFGTGITDDKGQIVDWEEKPQNPKTNLASMGIYVFDTEYLLNLLAEDSGEIDFGMHLIPKAIKRDKVYAYPFEGYWRDVGTIQAYWQANMDILQEDSDISPQEWGIHSNPEADGRGADRCPARFAAGSKVKGSMISAGCVIEGEVINSVLSPGVSVGPGAVVRDSVIIDDCQIGAGALVDLAILDKKVQVGSGSVIGCGDKSVANQENPTHLYTGITLIGKEVIVPDNTEIGRNVIINPRCSGDDFTSLSIPSGATV